MWVARYLTISCSVTKSPLQSLTFQPLRAEDNGDFLPLTLNSSRDVSYLSHNVSVVVVVLYTHTLNVHPQTEILAILLSKLLFPVV